MSQRQLECKNRSSRSDHLIIFTFQSRLCSNNSLQKHSYERGGWGCSFQQAGPGTPVLVQEQPQSWLMAAWGSGLGIMYLGQPYMLQYGNHHSESKVIHPGSWNGSQKDKAQDSSSWLPTKHSFLHMVPPPFLGRAFHTLPRARSRPLQGLDWGKEELSDNMPYWCICHTHEAKLCFLPSHAPYSPAQMPPTWASHQSLSMAWNFPSSPAPSISLCSISYSTESNDCLRCCDSSLCWICPYTVYVLGFKMLFAPLLNFILEACKERCQHLIIETKEDFTNCLRGTNRVVIFLFPFWWNWLLYHTQ